LDGQGFGCRPLDANAALPTVRGCGDGGTMGLRETNQALAELKTKLEFALSRLNDQDTHRTGVEEIREFLLALYPDWFPMVISCIGEAGANLKPLGRCESVKLLGLLAELHGEAVVPLLQRLLGVVVARLQDADLHLREACAETVFRLARSLVVEVADGSEGSPVFATLLKPLFGALGEHKKELQIGAAACICSVIQGSPSAVIRENLGRLVSRLVQHLNLPLAQAKPQLLSACIYASQKVEGQEFDEALPCLFPCLEACLQASSDWQTRKQAAEVLQVIGDNPELGLALELPLPANLAARPTPLQRRIASALEVVRQDKVRAVREAVKDVFSRWGLSRPAGPVGATRSSSPTVAAMMASAGETRRLDSGAARSCSPGPGAVLQLQQQDGARGGAGGGSVAELRGQSRGMRSRELTMEDSTSAAGSLAITISPDEEDAVTRKAARDFAVKAALLNADLNATKKPKPKRERISIFSGPTNSGFFTRKGRDDPPDQLIELPPPSPRPDSEFSGLRDEDEEFSAEVSTTAGSSSKASFAPPGSEEMPVPSRQTSKRRMPGPVSNNCAQEERQEEASTRVKAEVASWPPENPANDLRLDEDALRRTPRQELRGTGSAAPAPLPAQVSRGGQMRRAGTQEVASEDALSVGPEEPMPSVVSTASSRSSPSRRSRASRRTVSTEDSFPRQDDTEFSHENAAVAAAEAALAAALLDDPRAPKGRKEIPRTPPVSAREQAPQLPWPPSGGAEFHQPASPPMPPPLAPSAGVAAGVQQEMEGGSAPSRQRRDSTSSLARDSPTSDCSNRMAGNNEQLLAQLEHLGRRLQVLEEHSNAAEAAAASAAAAKSAAEAAASAAAATPSILQPPHQPEDMEFLTKQIENLSSRMQELEEERQRSEERLHSRVEQLARACSSQAEALRAQQERLESQERRLQTQEQQLRLQDQRMKQQERQLSEQGRQLQGLEPQLRLHGEQLEQQDQQLQEHEQQLEQNEQRLEEHGAVLEEMVASGKASPEEEDEEDADLNHETAVPSAIWCGSGGAGSSANVIAATDDEVVSRGPASGVRTAEVWSGSEYDLPLPRNSTTMTAVSRQPVKGPNIASNGCGLPGSGLASSSGDRPTLSNVSSGMLHHMSMEALHSTKGGVSPKKAVVLWERLLELCADQRFLEAYKQAIAEPEETCLLRLMRHTGPIVERLDAESNSRLIRRLIHILSSPSKDCAAASIEQIFAWLRQALSSGIHFTASQVEDLATALQRVAAPSSPLPANARAEASQLLARVSTLRRP